MTTHPIHHTVPLAILLVLLSSLITNTIIAYMLATSLDAYVASAHAAPLVFKRRALAHRQEPNTPAGDPVAAGQVQSVVLPPSTGTAWSLVDLDAIPRLEPMDMSDLLEDLRSAADRLPETP